MIRVLMLGSPPEPDAGEVLQAIENIEGVEAQFRLGRTTLEMECSTHACVGAEVIGDGHDGAVMKLASVTGTERATIFPKQSFDKELSSAQNI